MGLGKTVQVWGWSWGTALLRPCPSAPLRPCQLCTPACCRACLPASDRQCLAASADPVWLTGILTKRLT
jgi:hypothetical protein